MARVNIYLPDELARAAKGAGLNVSGIAQDALSATLAALDTDCWLDDTAGLRTTGADHDEVLDAVRAARDELGG